MELSDLGLHYYFANSCLLENLVYYAMLYDVSGSAEENIPSGFFRDGEVEVELDVQGIKQVQT